MDKEHHTKLKYNIWTQKSVFFTQPVVKAEGMLNQTDSLLPWFTAISGYLCCNYFFIYDTDKTDEKDTH